MIFQELQHSKSSSLLRKNKTKKKYDQNTVFKHTHFKCALKVKNLMLNNITWGHAIYLTDLIFPS